MNVLLALLVSGLLLIITGQALISLGVFLVIIAGLSTILVKSEKKPPQHWKYP